MEYRNRDAISDQIAMRRKLFMQLRDEPDDTSAHNLPTRKRIAYNRRIAMTSPQLNRGSISPLTF